MPQRIPYYPDAFSGWNVVSKFGSIISVIATILFAYIIYDIFLLTNLHVLIILEKFLLILLLYQNLIMKQIQLQL